MKYKRKVNKYLRDISRLLPAGYPDKWQVLNNLESDIEFYLGEHPNADWQDVLKEFGTAVDVAGSILGEPMNMDIISFMQRRDRLHNLITGLIMGSIAVMVILCGYRSWWIKYESHKVKPTVYIYEGKEVSSEIFKEKIESKYE